MASDAASTGQPTRFSQLVIGRAAERPADRAYTFLHEIDADKVSLTYGQIARRATAIAATTQQLTNAGDRVVLLYPPGLEFVAGMFGCLCSHAVAVPAYPPRTQASDSHRPDSASILRLKAILADAQPTVALTLSHLLPAVTEALEGSGIHCIATDTIAESAADKWKDLNITSETLAVLQYTSGSTATPKGVMLSHGNLLSNCAAIAEAFHITSDARLVLWLPPYHDMGLLGSILIPLYCGCPIWTMAPAAFVQKPLRWLTAISQYRATISGSPNFGYDLAARSITTADRATLDLSSWRTAFSGAEPIDATTFDRFAETFAPAGFRKNAFLPCYGLAEATLMVSAQPRETPFTLHNVPDASTGKSRVVSCGITPESIHVRIVDPQTKQSCTPGALGEIWVQSPGVAQGYWNNAQQTEQTFHARLTTGEGPFLRTGDLGFLTDTGLCIGGRLKDLIIVRGMKHFPQDIERSVQQSCPSLRPGAGAVFTLPDEDGLEKLVIVQEVNREHRHHQPEPILTSVRETLSTNHGLEALAIVLIRPGQFPKTTSGKVQRRACRERFLNNEFEVLADWHAPKPQPAIAMPLSIESAPSLEGWLAQKLADAVGVDLSEIDPQEPFARYGLDSVKGVALAGEIADHVGHDVPAMVLWDYPSIAQLAAYLSELPPQNKAA